MWQKVEIGGMVGGKKILSFFLVAFCTLGDIWMLAVGKKWAGYSSF